MRRDILEISEGSEHRFKIVLSLEPEAETDDGEEPTESAGAGDLDMERDMSAAGTETISTRGAESAEETVSVPSGSQRIEFKQDEAMVTEQPMRDADMRWSS
jgi:hypothetical protein